MPGAISMHKSFEPLGTVEKVRARAIEAGLVLTEATQIREIAPRAHLHYPYKVLRPSTAPEAREASELVYLRRPFSQKSGNADLVLGYAPVTDVLVYFWWTLDE